MQGYALELPDEQQIKAMLSRKIEDNRHRDDVILEFRKALRGENPIAAPQSMQYKVVVDHGYHLNAFINEKVSRYRPTPQYRVIPFSDDKVTRDASDETERAINILTENIELTSGDRSWKNVIEDVHQVDAGVERIERAPAAFWPDLIVGEDGKDNLMRICEDDEYESVKDKYLRQMGVPIKVTWVPLERFYPIFEGATMVEAFELEERSLRSVLANKLFDTTRLQGYALGQDGGMSQKVVILHYSNQQRHAYYALGPSDSGARKPVWPSLERSDSLVKGRPVLLHHYEHGIGRPLYNYVPGRGGGWLGGQSREETVMKALLALNQTADELRSQILTYVRSVLWPTRAMKYDPQARGGDDALPAAPTIPEGGVIAMWNTEELVNINQQIPDFRLAQWFYDSIEKRMAELAGSPGLFGQQQPGIETGYHQQLSLTQAEHLDAQLERSLELGAITRMLIIFEHVKAMGEKCYVHFKTVNARNRQIAKYLCIDPKKLDPMPMLEAKVRDPRPVDFLTGMQAVIQATQMRPGHNSPMLDDDTAREKFLGMNDNAAINRKILEQQYREKLLTGERVTQVLAQRLGLALAAAEGTSSANVQGASPAMVAAGQQLVASGETAQMGGVSPQTATDLAQGVGPVQPTGAGGALTGIGGGVPAGAPQPMQTMGRAQQLLQQVSAPPGMV